MKKVLQILLISSLYFLSFTLSIQSQSYPIAVTVQVVPPYSAYIADYTNKPVISFTNKSQTPLDVYIRGRFQNDRGQYIQTKPNVFSTIPIHVPGLQTVVVPGNQLDENYLDLNNLQTNLDDRSYSNLFQLGMMPEGFYSFCIYAYVREPNGGYIPVSDPQAAGSCFSYNVGYVVPPKILSPIPDENILPSPNQNVNITWTRPVGNMQSAALVYDLYLVKTLPGEDPNVSLTNAVQYGAGLFMKQSNIPINNFQFTNLTTFQLDEGSDYAVMVQARDLNGKTAFENNGRSEMAIFNYGQTPPVAVVEKPAFIRDGNCSCATNIASLDKTNHNTALKAGGSFTMASLIIRIGSLTEGTKASGDGTVLVNNVPIQVSFKDVVVNKDGIAIEGTASGKKANGFDFMNNGGAPVISTANYQSFIDQIKNYNLDAIKNGAGIPLPFGLNSIGAPDAVNIGVVDLQITPQQAAYDAIAVVQLADANNVLSLSARHVCFSNNSPMCGDALFVLNQDFQVPAINLTFKSYRSDQEPGTYVLLSKRDNTKKFHIHATYDFPVSLLTKTDGTEEKAVIHADAESWSDWTASITMDPFKLNALNDVVFNLKPGAFYDHSTLRNPAGMPTSFSDADLSEKNPVIGNALWTGFFIPTVSVALPSIVKNTKNTGNQLNIGATNLVLDKDGVTGIIGADNVVSLDDGSLGGWYCSVDKINIKLLNSAYKSGGLYGKVVLPLSDKNNIQSQIDYSCTLSAIDNGNDLSYEFALKQKNDLDFSAWWAHINLSNCSIRVTNNNESKSIAASADLSGSLSLAGNIQGYKIGIDLVKVEHLVVQTQAPYATVEKAVLGFASPQHSMAGFPISISNIHPVFTGMKAGLQFDFGLNLSDINNELLPKATTTLTVAADILPGARPTWKRLDLHPDKISISGNLAGLVHIDQGTLEFFHDDPVYGDGISGLLDASFTGLDAVKVHSNVRFGNKSFNYWYFDASVKFTPLVVAPGISINGFGGGAYYNMTRTANDNVSARDYFQHMDQYEKGAFKPQSGSLGFKAKVGVCSNDGYLFSGFGEIGMTFNTQNGFSVNSIDGKIYAELMTALADNVPDGNAPVQGIIDWHIGIADKVYSMSGQVQLNYPPIEPLVKGDGWFVMMADVGNHNYYLKLGEPANRIGVSIVDLLDMKAYFMAGNQIDASIPDPDPDIVDVSQLAGYRKLSYDPAAGGMVTGASLKLKQTLNYLVFYLTATAGVGFDINLARYTEGCGGETDLPGMNGWYAIGQVYAGLKAELGLEVDLFFYQGKVKAADVHANLLLRGGLPKPYWFDGYAQMGYEALGGAVKGNVNFHIAIGNKCVPPTQVFTMPLIQELRPADQADKVPLNANPEAIFNYPAEKDFKLITKNNNGDDELRTYHMVLENCQVNNLADNRVFADYKNPYSYPVFVDDDHKDLVLSPEDALLPQTKYRFDVKVKVQQQINDQWQDVLYKGSVVNASESVAFKTGECKLDELITDAKNRVGAYPFPNQRYFLQGESKQGAIILDKNYVCTKSPSEKYDLVVRFSALKNKSVIASSEKPLVLNGSRYLTFEIPSLPNQCLVKVEIIKRKKMSAQDNYEMFSQNLPMLTSVNRELSAKPGATPTISANRFAGLTPSKSDQLTNFNNNHKLKLSDKTVDIVLYQYYFRTSQYNTLKEKLNAMFFSDVTAYAPGGSPSNRLKAVETFDQYDANGFVSDKYNCGSTVYFSLPLVNFKENASYNGWLRNHAVPCLYDPIRKAGFNLNDLRNVSNITYREVQHLGIPCAGTDYYCTPLRPIDIRSYDPPLTKQEIAVDDQLQLSTDIIKLVSPATLLFNQSK